MQICEVFGKKVGHGNLVSHSNRATKRIWRPNLQTMKLMLDGKEVKVRVSTKAMKTLKGKNEDQVKKILLENKDNLSSKLAKILFSAN
ncbi:MULTISPECIES: 50S ribosomal protein L28 [Streptobacillus]|uniref:Large ribosomal subunit protein bL28 n=1 Tax=Streptobacillus moniliformis (strain ATCC 14647 / DSM 12112 / NCTC 10651 / 9901) TaxID=519441 RepID=D1AWU8_STRM9|nr:MULTISPECIES: 50S ribosomal protein L28 [Streptobacillus]ACZ00774.1 ribosomal protein L28 [Streptobacillus moniliformis DSM 12112]AVL42832.1 50S ribosomal protein L28 [Streptobacillus moniliformis]QXW65526.1 50S ribosomal protein L28 [Streptobacillus moniliformis]SQA14096.1 50S ribosomal protein L28 [Streptobacillus moniliformis]